MPAVKENAASLRQIASDSLAEIRRLVRDTRPPMLDDLGLEAALDRQLEEVVAECGSHSDVVAALEATPGVDVVTLDLGMPGGSFAATIQDILRVAPTMGIVVLTMHDDPTHARLALAAGARGYVVKSAADRLFLSVKTIESYRSRLMAKLGLKNRAELTRLAFDAGLVGNR